MNHNSHQAAIKLENEVYTDLLTQRQVSATVEIEPYGVMILHKRLSRLKNIMEWKAGGRCPNRPYPKAEVVSFTIYSLIIL
ncbi:Beta-galactosidase C-terminal domain [Paenibacillus sp. Soil522]|uniref:Beta-galactosidase C-terminal domain n=1 Tax=Paenibacillus sp. Soil522 TaxID=1736388 RepID=UPI00138ECE40